MRVFLFFIHIIALHSSHELCAQKKYSTQKAALDFTSEAELELIKAASGDTRGLIDPTSNQFAFSVEVKSFKGFNSALQANTSMRNIWKVKNFQKRPSAVKSLNM